MTATTKDVTRRARSAPRAATVSAGYALNLARFALSFGINPQALAERSGVDPETLDDPDARVPMADYVALMRAAKALAWWCQADWR